MTTKRNERGHYNECFYTVGSSTQYTDYSVNWLDNAGGVSNALWQYQIRNGLPATTGFSGQKVEVLQHDFNSKYTQWYPSVGSGLLTKTRQGFDTPATLPTHLSPSITIAENAALTKLYSRLRALDSEAQGMTILAELRETIHMLKHPALAIREASVAYFKRVEKLAHRTARRKLHKAIASTYLEYSFGLVPLINDTISVLNAIDAQGRPRRALVSATGESSLGTTTTVMDNKVDSWFRVNSNTTTKLSVRYKVGLGLTTGTPPTSSLRQLLGFTPSEFVPTLWDIVPWSFLVDYFTNVGDIISAVTYSRSRLSWSNRTERTVTDFSRVWLFDEARTRQASGAVYVSGSGSGTTLSRRTSFSRTNTLPGFPSFELSVPGLVSKKWLNIAALANQHDSLLKLLHKR